MIPPTHSLYKSIIVFQRPNPCQLELPHCGICGGGYKINLLYICSKARYITNQRVARNNPSLLRDENPTRNFFNRSGEYDPSRIQGVERETFFTH